MERSAFRLCGMGAAFALISCLVAGDARALGAVGIQSWGTGNVEELLDGPGASVNASAGGLAASMANNPSLDGSAWAHTGAWWILEIQNAPGAVVRVQADDAAQLSPGVSVWATGSAPFDGGTTGFGGEISTASFGTPHSFNAFGPLGDTGTLWMEDGQGGNAKELLGYAVSGPSHAGVGGWGETIEHGAHDESLSDDYVASVSGSVGAGFAELDLANPANGWYLIYVGGTDPSLEGGVFTLSVTTVPEPGTGLLLISGLAVLGARFGHGASRRSVR